MSQYSPSESIAACPDEKLLRAAVDGTLTGAEQARLAEHLTHCEKCQSRMQRIAGAEDVLPVAVVVESTRMADTQPSDALDDVMRRLRRNEATPPRTSDAELLQFLEESSDSGVLGRFAGYDVLQLVGRGGMGLVLKAYDASLNRMVAIKVLLPQLAANPDARQRFLREAQAAAAVIHENVVTIHAVDEHDNLPYLVMEYVEGQSLQTRIESGTLDLEEILRIGTQISAGLAAAHEQGLVHRDIKPANILLQNGIARVKITDFGLAKAVDDVSLTRTGTISGTPQYLSPEQADSHKVDHRTDLFSFGGVLYAMCTGRPPFVGDSTARIIRQVCDAQPRPIENLNEETPPWLIAIIRRLLEKDPRRRYDSAKDVEQLLKQRLLEVQTGSLPPVDNSKLIRSMAFLGLAVATIAAIAYFGPKLAPPNSSTSAAASSTGEDAGGTAAPVVAKGDFYVSGQTEPLATLPDAIQAANDGDVIEIRGNGPYQCEPMPIQGKQITIRAADGFRPEIVIHQGRSGLLSDAVLRLEGLRITAEKEAGKLIRNPLNTGIVRSRGDKLEVINCEIDGHGFCGIAFEGLNCEIKNSVVRTPMAFSVVWYLTNASSTDIENTRLAGRAPIVMIRAVPLDENDPCRLNVNQSTLVGDMAVRYDARSVMNANEERIRLGDAPMVVISMTNTIIDVEQFLLFNALRFSSRIGVGSGLEELLLLTVLDWKESNNYYRQGMRMAVMNMMRTRVPFLPGDNDLAEWQAHFGIEEAGATEGAIEYVPSLERPTYEVKSLTPEPAAEVQVGAQQTD